MASWFTAALTVLALEVVLAVPRLAFPWLPLALAAVLFGVTILLSWPKFGRRLFTWLVPAELLLLGGVGFLSFTQQPQLQHFIVMVIAVLIWLLLETMYTMLHDRPRYQPHSAETISGYVNLLSIFFLASCGYSLVLFIRLEPWVVALGLAWAAVLLTGQLFWVSDIATNDSWRHLVVASLLVGEISYAVTWLPSSVYVGGGLVALVYYLTTGLSRNWLLGIWERNVVRRYLVVTVLLLVAILATAKWH